MCSWKPFFTMSNNLPVNRDKQIREHPYLDIHKNKMKIKDINGQSIGLYGFYDYYFTLNRYNLIMRGELYFHSASKNYNIDNVVRDGWVNTVDYQCTILDKKL